MKTAGIIPILLVDGEQHILLSIGNGVPVIDH